MLFGTRSDLSGEEASISVYDVDGEVLEEKSKRVERDEVVLIIRGFGSVQIGSYEGSFGPGTLVYARSGTWRSWKSESGDEAATGVAALGVHVPANLVPEAFLKLREAEELKAFLERVGAGAWTTLSAYERIQTRIRTLIGVGGMLRVARTQALLELLSNINSWQVVDEKGLSKNRQWDRARFKQVQTYLDTHFRESVRRDTLAELVGMSPNSFSRFFRRVSGAGLSEYLSALRVRHAATLLVARRRMPIALVARESGFRNLSVFNQQFRKRLGTTPRTYRKQQDFELVQP